MRRKTEKILSTPPPGGVSTIALALAASLLGATGSYAIPVSAQVTAYAKKPIVLAQLRLGIRNNRRAINTKRMTIKKMGRGSRRIGAAGLKTRRFTRPGARAKGTARGGNATPELGRASKLSIGKASGPDAARLRMLGKAKKSMTHVRSKTGAGTGVRTTRNLLKIHPARKAAQRGGVSPDFARAAKQKGSGLTILTTNRRGNLSGAGSGKVKSDRLTIKKYSEPAAPESKADRLRFLRLLGVKTRGATPAAIPAPPAGPVPIPYPVFGRTNSLGPAQQNSVGGNPIAIEEIALAHESIARARSQGVPFGHTIGIPHEHQNPQSSVNPPRTRFLAIYPHGASTKPRNLHQYGAGLTDFVFAPNPAGSRGARRQQGRVIANADFNEATPSGGGYNEIFLEDKSGNEEAAGLKLRGALKGKYSGTYIVKGVSHLAKRTGENNNTDTADSHDRHANAETSYLPAPDDRSSNAGKPLLIVAEDVEGEAGLSPAAFMSGNKAHR